VNENGNQSGHRIIQVLRDNKVHSNLYWLPANRSVEQRRDETYERNLGYIPTALHIQNQNVPFLHCRLHDVLHNSVAQSTDATIVIHLVRIKGLHDGIEELRDPRPFAEFFL
jgi:hypothetical protein